MQTRTLRNGVEMPVLAFGCAFGDWVGRTDFQGILPEQAWRAFPLALKTGYRSFDGAHVYCTERILGGMLGQEFAKGTLKRDDLFLTTKVAHPNAPILSPLRTWDFNEVDDVARKVREQLHWSLDDLCVGYVDLLLIHWPGPFENKDKEAARKTRATIWKTFIELYKRGLTRAIGVSNFSIEHLKELMEDVPEEAPMVNQIEIHPYCRYPALEAFCDEQEIVLSAYSPFASGAFDMFKDETLLSIAKQHNVSVGQMILRWHVQSGRTALPKTSKEHRMLENLDIFGFTLTDEEIKQIDQLGVGTPQRTNFVPDNIL